MIIDRIRLDHETQLARISITDQRPLRIAMNAKRPWIHACVLGAGLAYPGAVLASGNGPITRCIDNCATIPYGAQPALCGTYVNQFIHIQETKAEMDDFVLYKHMWFRGGAELGPLGRYQVDMIVKRLPSVPFPVVIETSKNEALDNARREAIATMLAARGLTDKTRIIVAYPQAEGLYGEEAPLIYNGLLRGAANRGGYGAGFGGGGFGGGGFGSGGFGGFGGGGFGGGGFRGF
jgi:hypothetical protein